jgi:hypothetical protein
LSRFHPVFGIRLRGEARDLGFGFLDIGRMMRALDEDALRQAVTQVATVLGQAAPPEALEAIYGTAAIGDGSLWELIQKFLNSEFGKMLMQFLLALLAGKIGLPI